MSDEKKDSTSTPEPNPPLSGGYLEAGLASAGSLRWVAVDTTGVIEEARRRLDLGPLATVALGRLLTGAALLHRLALKTPARLVLEVRGDGPLGAIVAEADEAGGLRGMVGEPHAVSPDADDPLRLGPAIGEGTLTVIRHGRDGERYNSQVELVSGEIGTDLAHYLQQSEQTNSAILLGVLVNPNGVVSAGGLGIDALPSVEPEVVSELERNISLLDGVSRPLASGGVAALRSAVLDSLDVELHDERPLGYHCGCSREALLPKLAALSAEDRSEVVGDDGQVVAECAFCGERYLFTEAELQAAASGSSGEAES